MQCYPREFQYKQPPYEYEFERLPMDLILGDVLLRRALEDGESCVLLEEKWQSELTVFLENRKKYLIYN